MSFKGLNPIGTQQPDYIDQTVVVSFHLHNLPRSVLLPVTTFFAFLAHDFLILLPTSVYTV